MSAAAAAPLRTPGWCSSVFPPSPFDLSTKLFFVPAHGTVRESPEEATKKSFSLSLGGSFCALALSLKEPDRAFLMAPPVWRMHSNTCAWAATADSSFPSLHLRLDGLRACLAPKHP